MRLDKFLKVSRLIKRRTVANEACDAGRVLVNDKPAKASVKVKPGDILGAIAGESGISGRLVGSIDMYDKYTFVEVPQDCAEEVLECMKNARIKGKSIHMEPANGR